ncbi:hypothetical protein Salat_1411900 [Sesamum alatum]|uniref:Uncharacterized protein n=1 Tax=Sesamum alatum TaxID=300844 RepID=A0AAE1YB66_9LAMI|nr:hypothetical protein Salat_1411900 [Sesamum alatum]
MLLDANSQNEEDEEDGDDVTGSPPDKNKEVMILPIATCMPTTLLAKPDTQATQNEGYQTIQLNEVDKESTTPGFEISTWFQDQQIHEDTCPHDMETMLAHMANNLCQVEDCFRITTAEYLPPVFTAI